MNSEATAISGITQKEQAKNGKLALAITCILLSLGFVFWHFITRQTRFAIEETSDWGHTLVIPFMALYLVYLNRDRYKSLNFKTTWWGLLFVVMGIAWYMFCWVGPQAIKHHNTMALGVGITLFGVITLFFGWKIWKYAWFPFLFMMIFGVTISRKFMNIITYELQDIAAYGSHKVLLMLGYDATLAGNTLNIFHYGEWYPLNIAEACSGMRMVVAFLALGVFLAYLYLSRYWQRITLVLLAVPLAVFVNILRVVTLGLLSLIDINLAAGDFHLFIGMVWLVPALLIYLGMIWILNNLIIEDTETPVKNKGKSTKKKKTISSNNGNRNSGQYRFGKNAGLAILVSCTTLLICGAGFQLAMTSLNIHLMKKPITLRRPFDKIPRVLGAWERFGDDQQLDEATIDTLGTNQYLSRGYVKEDVGLVFHITYYTDQIDAIPHVPERCQLAGGRTPVGQVQHIPLPLEKSKWIEDYGPPNKETGLPYHKVTSINQRLRESFTVRMPIHDIVLRVWKFQEPVSAQDSEEMDLYFMVGYFFIANGRATPNALEVRKLAFDKTDEFAYYCKVEFGMQGRGDNLVDNFVAETTDLLDEILPQLMRCLPDWSEVEAGKYPVKSDKQPETISNEA